MKPGSQADRIVQVLRNAHGWLTTQQILSGAGYCSFSARISELRSAGFDIRCRKLEGMPPGPDAQEYLLVSEPLAERGDTEEKAATDRAAGPSWAPRSASGPSIPLGQPDRTTLPHDDGAAGRLTLFDLPKGAYANG